MAKHIVKNAKVYLGKYDFSGLLSLAQIEYGRELQDATDQDSNSRQRLPGLETWSFTHTAFWDQGTDEANDAALGVDGVPLTVAVPGTAGADGSQAYFGTVGTASYQLGGTVGDAHMITGSGEGDGALLNGTIMVTGAKTTTGNGTGRELGAVLATQKMYAALHVTSASAADTLDVIVESDATDGWVGAETTRITFDQTSAAEYQFETSVVGAITDTWWRIGYTIAGSDPSFTFVVTLGIK